MALQAAKLQALLNEFRSLDPELRSELLLEFADRFHPVEESIAQKPYPESARVPGCESEVFAFCTARPDGTRDFHFAVENPQGISAMALAAILSETLNGEEPAAIEQVPLEIVSEIFGRTLSMGKGQGLMSMLGVVKSLAKAS